MDIGYSKSSCRLLGKLGTDHTQERATPFLLLIRGPVGRQEALPLWGQIAQSHGWSKYPPQLGGLDN